MYSFSPLLMPLVVMIMLVIAACGVWKSRGNHGYRPRPHGFGGGFAIGVTLFITYRMLVSLLYIYSLHETLEDARLAADIVDCYLKADLCMQAMALSAFVAVAFVKYHAIRLFRIYLVAYVGYIWFLGNYMPHVVERLYGFPATTLMEFTAFYNMQAMESMPLALTFTGLWLLFLHKSRRVRHTWPSISWGSTKILTT